MFRLALVITLAAAATASMSLADPVPATAPPATQATALPATTVAPATVNASPEDKIVCKYEVPIGSRLGGHKVCQKKSEWEAQSLEDRNKREFGHPAGIAGVK